MIRAAIFAAILAVAPPAAAGQKIALLPEGVLPSDSPAERGLFAETGIGNAAVESRLEALSEGCAAKGQTVRVESEELRYKGIRRIYRTAGKLAVYEDRPDIETNDADCSARISLRRKITGGLGEWRKIRTSDWSESEADCPARVARECRSSTVAGIRAMCTTLGDPFQGSVTCVSSQRDLSYGLLLSFATYLDYDDGNRIDWHIGEVDVDALIDPAVFASFRK